MSQKINTKEFKTSSNTSVIFFDGLCNLCNNTISVLMKIDKNQIFKYTSLQGQYSQQFLEINSFKDKDSIIFYSESIFYKKSEAIIQILIKIGGIYKFLGLSLSVLPLFILNKLYDLIAQNRYRIFGKTATCRVPSNQEKHLFIP